MSLLIQENHVGRVIHTQIHLENLINDFITSVVQYPVHLKPIQLDYFGAVHLALALGLSVELKKPLNVLGKMRNDFAHNLDTKIDSNYMNNFYQSFSLEQKNNMMKFAKESKQSWVVDGLSWKKVPPAEQFIFMCISLYYSCLKEIDKQKHQQEMNKLGSVALRLLSEE